jgi:diaminohydroxyphosphoribosylaminopyrimidine deaminase/5-amino-6-(5-phosphoribosylamino)uracil reductase
MPTDEHFLAHAIRLGARGLGRTAPNPSVGCVLVKDGAIIATGVTGDGGRPHAETVALNAAGNAARGAIAYVSLEPCAHHGKTPPCAEALIKAGVVHVVVAAIDPDPRVAGSGIAMLEAAGISVEQKHLPEAARLNRGFFKRVADGMPYVAMKIATSLDGMLGDHTGASKWITGEAARQHGHFLRSEVDAVLTGIGTVLADDPQLTVRPPLAPHPNLVRIVADRQLRLPLTSHLVKSANTHAVWAITTTQAVELNASHASDLREAGVKLLVLEEETLAPTTILTALGGEGITRVLLEAGAHLSTTFLAAHAVDRLYWYRAPILLGSGGKPAIQELATTLARATHAYPAARIPLGNDHCEIYEMNPCSQA